MKNRILTIAVGLASMTGVLLVSGVVWAQATKTPVTGLSGVNFNILDDGEIWTDEEGVLHIRDRKTRQRYTGDVAGVQLRVAAWNFDLSSGEGDFHGSFTFTGYVLGELVTAVGRNTGACIDWLCEDNLVWFLSDGRKINMSTTPYEAIGGLPTEYEGILLAPPAHQ